VRELDIAVENGSEGQIMLERGSKARELDGSILRQRIVESSSESV